MLFAYTYVPHAMEKMQKFIDFIFYEVWCKAPGNGGFRFELFDANAELKELMEVFYYGDTQGGDFFFRTCRADLWSVCPIKPGANRPT